MKKQGKIFIYGDTHGSYEIHKLDKHSKLYSKDDFIIICGDFGVLWSNQMDEAEENTLEHLNSFACPVLFIDGNHENFKRIYALPQVKKFGSMVGRYSHNVFHLGRGQIYQLLGKNFFTMGGALSIDKAYRKINESYWLEEDITDAQVKAALETIDKFEGNIDYIITHTIPHRVMKKMAHYMIVDHKIHDKNTLQLEKIFMKLEEKKHRVKAWFFGHWHQDLEFKLEDFDITFYCLYDDAAVLQEDETISKLELDNMRIRRWN